MKNFILLLSVVLFSTLGVNAQKQITYPVIVTFNSMCCGVPDSKPVMKFIKDFKKQHKIKWILVDSIGPMGREGEYYLAFKLKEMTASQRVKFIRQLKKIVPTMTDRGSAEIKEMYRIDKTELGSRTGITTLKL